MKVKRVLTGTPEFGEKGRKDGKKGIGIVIAKEKYRAIRRRGRQWRDSSIAREGYEGLIMA